MPGIILMALLTLIIKLSILVHTDNGIQYPEPQGSSKCNNTTGEQPHGQTIVERPIFSAVSLLLSGPSALGVICLSISRYLGLQLCPEPFPCSLLQLAGCSTPYNTDSCNCYSLLSQGYV